MAINNSDIPNLIPQEWLGFDFYKDNMSLFTQAGPKLNNLSVSNDPQGPWISNPYIYRSPILQKVAFGAGRFVAVGEKGASYYSLDGINWTFMPGLAATYTSSGTTYDIKYNDVVYGNNMFVCVGQFGKAYYSRDLISWLECSPENETRTIYGIIYYSSSTTNEFICVGGNGLSYRGAGNSSSSWTAVAGLSSTIQAVGIIGDKCVCTSSGSSISSSKHYYLDLSSSTNSWTIANTASTDGTYRCYATSSDGTKCICLATTLSSSTTPNKNFMCYTSDGTTWTEASDCGLFDSVYGYWSVAYCNDRFICVGPLKYSFYYDNTKWRPMIGLNADYTGIAFGNNLAVAVGRNGYTSTYVPTTYFPSLNGYPPLVTRNLIYFRLLENVHKTSKDLFKKLNVLAYDYFDSSDTDWKTSAEDYFLDLVGYIYGISRSVVLYNLTSDRTAATTKSSCTLSNYEFLIYILATIARSSFSGTRKNLREINTGTDIINYTTLLISPVEGSDEYKAGWNRALGTITFNHSRLTDLKIRYCTSGQLSVTTYLMQAASSVSDGLLRLFYSGFLTQESLGVTYSYVVGAGFESGTFGNAYFYPGNPNDADSLVYIFQ